MITDLEPLSVAEERIRTRSFGAITASKACRSSAAEMTTDLGPLAVAEERIRTRSFGAITGSKRLPFLGG